MPVCLKSHVIWKIIILSLEYMHADIQTIIVYFFLFMTLESAYNCCKPQLYELLVVDHIQSSLEYVESLKFTLNFSFCCVEINSLSIHAL